VLNAPSHLLVSSCSGRVVLHSEVMPDHRLFRVMSGYAVIRPQCAKEPFGEQVILSMSDLAMVHTLTSAMGKGFLFRYDMGCVSLTVLSARASDQLRLPGAPGGIRRRQR
jgi:hypothetical protein